MLKVISSLLVCCSFLTSVEAQKKEYLVEYKGTSLPRDTAQEPLSLIMAFSQMRSYMKMILEDVETVMITDAKEQKSLILMQMMGMKLGTSIEGSDYAKIDFMKDFVNDFTLENTKQKRKILGYNCNLILAHPKEGKEPFQIWYTEDLAVVGTFNLTAYGSKINGLPLLMTWKQEDNSTIQWQAIRINTSRPDKALFDLSLPYGYSLISSDLFLND